MGNIIAVDPGPVESAYVVWDGTHIKTFGKHPNEFFLRDGFCNSIGGADILVIEQVCCYGMPVGAEIFETVFFSGRLAQHFINNPVRRIPRKDVKMHLCGTVRAKDSNIIQVLKDRFGDKGTKKNPGFFFGFHKDIWQAFALGLRSGNDGGLNDRKTSNQVGQQQTSGSHIDPRKGNPVLLL